MKSMILKLICITSLTGLNAKRVILYSIPESSDSQEVLGLNSVDLTTKDSVSQPSINLFAPVDLAQHKLATGMSEDELKNLALASEALLKAVSDFDNFSQDIKRRLERDDLFWGGVFRLSLLSVFVDDLKTRLQSSKSAHFIEKRLKNLILKATERIISAPQTSPLHAYKNELSENDIVKAVLKDEVGDCKAFLKFIKNELHCRTSNSSLSMQEKNSFNDGLDDLILLITLKTPTFSASETLQKDVLNMLQEAHKNGELMFSHNHQGKLCRKKQSQVIEQLLNLKHKDELVFKEVGFRNTLENLNAKIETLLSIPIVEEGLPNLTSITQAQAKAIPVPNKDLKSSTPSSLSKMAERFFKREKKQATTRRVRIPCEKIVSNNKKSQDPKKVIEKNALLSVSARKNLCKKTPTLKSEPNVQAKPKQTTPRTKISTNDKGVTVLENGLQESLLSDQDKSVATPLNQRTSDAKLAVKQQQKTKQDINKPQGSSELITKARASKKSAISSIRGSSKESKPTKKVK